MKMACFAATPDSLLFSRAWSMNDLKKARTVGTSTAAGGGGRSTRSRCALSASRAAAFVFRFGVPATRHLVPSGSRTTLR